MSIQAGPRGEAPGRGPLVPPRASAAGSDRITLPAPLGRRDVHVWWIDLAPDASAPRADVLTADELQRAACFATGDLRERFMHRRSALRRVLGAYLGVGPGEVRLRHDPCTACGGPHGKPAVASELDLRFNAASSAGIGVVAVTVGREVGIDVERDLSTAAADQVAGVCLADDELSMLESLDAEARARAVTVGWTRKEAYLKARGVGLNVPPDRVAIEYSHGRPRVVRTPGDAEAAVRWILRDLEPRAGYAAALAVKGPIESLVEIGQV